MSQHDMSIANQGFPAFRSDLNDALQALVSQNSGATAPSSTFANQLWYDTANNILKMRNEDNDAWISIATLDQATDTLVAIGGKTLPTGDILGTSDTQTLTNKTINASQLVDASVTSAKLDSNAQYMGFKNRIINGAMMIDQRNAGASVSVAIGDGNTICPDRNRYQRSSTFCAASAQQVTTVPTGQGFNYSSLTTIITGGAAAAGDYLTVGQAIEGFNIADLQYGTANAKTVTASFWAQASISGTYSCSLFNATSGYAYINTFTLVANTWTFVTVTFPGDTARATNTTNGQGLYLRIDLGSGSNYSGTAGIWQNGAFKTSGSVNLSATNGATFYITGVQLEKGSTATSFDYRPYGTELALCQRYCYVDSYTGNAYTRFPVGFASNTNQSIIVLNFPVTMRTIPSLTWNGAFAEVVASGGGATGTSVTITTDGNSSSHAAVAFNYSSGSVTLNSLNGVRTNNSTTWYARFEAEL